MDEKKQNSENEVILPLKLDPHTFARLRAFAATVNERPEDCASQLFRDLILDDEFENAPSRAFH